MLEGKPSNKILILNDYPGVEELATRTPLAGEARLMIDGAAVKVGLAPSQLNYISSHNKKNLTPEQRDLDIELVKAHIKRNSYHVLVALGDYTLNLLTGLKGIYKHHCSILKSRAEFGLLKVVPIHHPREALRQFNLSAFIILGLNNIRMENVS